MVSSSINKSTDILSTLREEAEERSWDPTVYIAPLCSSLTLMLEEPEISHWNRLRKTKANQIQ